MKFSCDRCHTRYSIPDERVKGKVLKIRCKTCGNVITVGGRKKRELKTTDSSPSRRARAVRPKASAVGLPAAGQQPKMQGSSPLTRKRTQAPSQPRKQPQPEPQETDFSDKTVVSDPNIDMSALRAELAGGPATVSDVPASSRYGDPEPMPAELEEWYLADDNGEYGPMTFSELAARIRRREHGPDAQVWREGFPDWMDLEDVPELRPHLKHVPPPRVRHKDDWGEAEPASAPVKLAEPPRELAPKPEPVPIQSPAEQGRRKRKAAAQRPLPAQTEATKATDSSQGPPKRKPAAAAFFGGDALEAAADEHISAPAPALAMADVAAVPVVATTTPREDRNRLYVILFAIMGGVALLALIGLVVYLIVRDTGHTSHGKSVAVAQKQSPATKQGGATNMQATQPGPDVAPQPDMAPAQKEEELIMDPVELSLPARPARGTAAARPRTGAGTAKARKPSGGSGSKMGSFSPGGFGSFGPVGIRGRRGLGPAPRSSSSTPHAVRATRKVTKPEVMAVIRRHVHRLKRCYERAVRLHPTELRRAKMKVSIRVSSSGRVTKVRITPGRYRGLSLGDCIVSTIKSWKFPPSTESYGTGFPLSFVGK